MVTGLCRKASLLMQHSYRILRNQGMGELVHTLHRYYVHKHLPLKTGFLPTAMEVEITTHCNLYCSMCRGALDYFDDSKLQHISIERFALLLEQLDFLDIISFRGAGEPTMHPNIVDLATMAAKAGKKVRITTNGLLMDKALQDALVSIPVSEIVFSIDASDPKTYASIRRGANLEVVLKQLKSLGEMLTGRDDVILAVMFVVMHSNFKELLPLAEIISNIGVSYLAPKMLNPGPHPEIQKLALKDSDIEEFRDILKKLSKLKISKQAENALINGNENKLCMNIWEAPFIAINGDLSACPSTYYNEKASYGNIFDEDFSAIWNNIKTQKQRNRIKLGSNPHCQVCPVMNNKLLSVQ